GAFVNLHVYLAPPGGAPDTSALRLLTASDTCLPVPPGRHDVVIRFDEHAADLWRIAGVDVPAGGDCPDPRPALTWSEPLAMVSLTVLAPDGSPGSGLQVTRFTADTDGKHWSGTAAATDQDGRATLLVEKNGGMVKVGGGERWRSVLLQGVKTDQRLVLQ